MTDGNGADSGSTKPSNPKDAIAGRKLDLGLVPETALVGLAIAFLEGALKYGRYNWRIAGVSASVYYAALNRHTKKWWNGQDRDPTTGVHHLDNAQACIAIMRDAELYGMLNDNRPPCPDPDAMARLIDSMEDQVAQLKETFKDHNPKQFTIADTPRVLEEAAVAGVFVAAPAVVMHEDNLHVDRPPLFGPLDPSGRPYMEQPSARSSRAFDKSD